MLDRPRPRRRVSPRASSAGLGAVVHLNCPRCGLTIVPKATWLVVEHCPRCLARRRLAVRMFASTLPAAELYAKESRSVRDAVDAAERSDAQGRSSRSRWPPAKFRPSLSMALGVAAVDRPAV